MKQLKLLTEIHVFENFKEFVDEFKVGEEDLILTRSSIYNEFIQKLNLDCNLVLQNKYGNGEPSDEMINQIIDDIKDINFKRVIAIGGGTVIDIAKLLIFKDTKDCVDLFERIASRHHPRPATRRARVGLMQRFLSRPASD